MYLWVVSDHHQVCYKWCNFSSYDKIPWQQFCRIFWEFKNPSEYGKWNPKWFWNYSLDFWSTSILANSNASLPNGESFDNLNSSVKSTFLGQRTFYICFWNRSENFSSSRFTFGRSLSYKSRHYSNTASSLHTNWHWRYICWRRRYQNWC